MQQRVLEIFDGAVGAMIISAAARALPVPKDGCNPGYLWFYQFSHLLLANFDRVQAASAAANKECPPEAK
jgi:hypothetical protein